MLVVQHTVLQMLIITYHPKANIYLMVLEKAISPTCLNCSGLDLYFNNLYFSSTNFLSPNLVP